MHVANVPLHSPHPVLDAYYPGAEQKSLFVNDLFARTAGHYNRINAVAFWGTGGWYRRQALRRAGLQRGMRLLDVASGTGAVARAATKIIDPGAIICCDPCQNMLTMAATKVRGARCVQASAECLPFESCAFDFLTLGYALRHVTDLSQAFAEFYRVMANGGRLLILEITKPNAKWIATMARLYFRDVVPLVSLAVTRDRQVSVLMRYFWETIDACVSPEAIVAQLQQAGFSDVQRHVELGLFSEYTALKAEVESAGARRR